MMKLGIGSVLLLSLLLSGSTEAAIIRLRSQQTVQSPLIVLGAVAEVTESDPETITTLQRMTIAPAPAAGRSTRVTLDLIRRELALRGIDQTELTFTGASECLVQHEQEKQPEQQASVPAGAVQPTEKWKQTLQTSIQNYLQSKTSEPGTLQVRLADSEYQRIQRQFPAAAIWTVTGGQQPWTGLQSLVLQSPQADGSLISLPVICEVSLKPQVLALKHGLPRGQVIRVADLMWVDSEETNQQFVDPEQLVGTETVRHVRAGQPVRREEVRQIPLIRRNDVVSVTVRLGQINVRRYCRSLDEGTLGQFVTLTPVDGKEKVTARVSGLREAVIELESMTGGAGNSPQSIPQSQSSLSQQSTPVVSSSRPLQLVSQINIVGKGTALERHSPSLPKTTQVDSASVNPVAISASPRPDLSSSPVASQAAEPFSKCSAEPLHGKIWANRATHLTR